MKSKDRVDCWCISTKEPEGFVEPPTVPSDAQMNEAGELQGPPPDDVSGGEQPTQQMEEICHHSNLTCLHKENGGGTPPENGSQPPSDE